MIVLLWLLLLWALPVEAATHYIRDGGSASTTGTGSCNSGGSGNWNTANACDTLPATLVRGDTYLLADGSYGSRTFSTANSSTTLITIKKATIADHGTSTGWVDTYGDGQAIFTDWMVTTDYWLFDGVSRNSDWRTGGIDQYGIRVKCTGDCKPLRIDGGDGTSGADNTTFQYIDFEGGGRDIGAANSDIVYTLYGGTNITFQYCALHDADRTIFLTRGDPTNWVLDHNYIARQASSPAVHGEMWSLTDATNITISHNVIEDTEGTACLVAGINNGDWNGALIHGNTVRHTAAYISGGREGCSSLIFVADDASQTNTGSNIVVQNNTFVNLQTSSSMITIENNPSGGNIFRNNMLYNTEDSGLNGIDTVDSNWIFSTVGSPGGTNLVTCTVSCDLFADLSAGDFHLASATTAGATLSAPYTTDPDGVTRGGDGTWDRGAFEFGTAAATRTGAVSGGLRGAGTVRMQ